MASTDIVMYFTDELEKMLNDTTVSNDEIIKAGVSRPNTGIGTFDVNKAGEPVTKRLTSSAPHIYIIKDGTDENPVYTLVTEDGTGGTIEREIIGKVPPRSE